MESKAYNTGKQETLLKLTTKKQAIVKTDKMMVDVIMQNSGGSYEEVSALAEKDLQQFLEILEGFNVKEEHVHTTFFQINTEYSLIEDGEEYPDYSYQMDFFITVPVCVQLAKGMKEKLDQLDAGVDIHFKLYVENMEAEKETVLKAAIAENRGKAKSIAKQLNKAICGIQTITYGKQEGTQGILGDKLPLHSRGRGGRTMLCYSGMKNQRKYYQELEEGNVEIMEEIYIEWLLV